MHIYYAGSTESPIGTGRKEESRLSSQSAGHVILENGKKLGLLLQRVPSYHSLLATIKCPFHESWPISFMMSIS